MAKTLRVLQLQLIMLTVASGFFVPKAKKKGEHGRTNDEIIKCPHCQMDVNIVDVKGGPWICPHCDKRGDQ